MAVPVLQRPGGPTGPGTVSGTELSRGAALKHALTVFFWTSPSCQKPQVGNLTQAELDLHRRGLQKGGLHQIRTTQGLCLVWLKGEEHDRIRELDRTARQARQTPIRECESLGSGTPAQLVQAARPPARGAMLGYLITSLDMAARHLRPCFVPVSNVETRRRCRWLHVLQPLYPSAIVPNIASSACHLFLEATCTPDVSEPTSNLTWPDPYTYAPSHPSPLSFMLPRSMWPRRDRYFHRDESKVASRCVAEPALVGRQLGWWMPGP